MSILKWYALLLWSVFGLSALQAQSYVPGQSYFGNNNYIEYIAGNMPIILSAPHGGYLTPVEIPDRDCPGCSYLRDVNTQEIVRAAAQSLYDLTGCYPHIVINRLHRKKLDANRAIIEAADSNAIGEQAWYDFHTFMDSARAQVLRTRGRGLYLDIHGHGHDIQRTELGYLLSVSELQLTDNELNTPNYTQQSSIRNLIGNNLGALTHAELLRGEHSLGELLAQSGYAAVPSMSDPFPDTGEPYFNGGYNTNRYGTLNGGDIDAIQIECHYDGLRDNTANIGRFTDSLAVNLVNYLQHHYFTTAPLQWCQTPTALLDVTTTAPRIFPNPFGTKFSVQIGNPTGTDYRLQVLDINGKLILDQKLQEGTTNVSLPHPLQPLYIVKMFNNTGLFYSQKVVHYTF